MFHLCWILFFAMYGVECSCPSGYTLELDGICIHYEGIPDTPVNRVHDDAVNICKSSGATPVIIHNQNEQDYWANITKSLGWSIVLGLRCNSLTNAADWDDGSIIDFQHFGNGDTCTEAPKGGYISQNGYWYRLYSFDAQTSDFAIYCMTPEIKSDADPYCNCTLDKKFGMPDGWDSTQIWVDVIIILDTSEAMGEVSLVDASTLIESFIGNDDGDVLITDTNSDFYTRVGLIAMSDKAEVLYNLNMTKTDKVVGKAQIKKGLTQINVDDAFNAALNMFADGLKTIPERVNTRQVIYYMTNSDPKTVSTSMNVFKTSQGIIIVNNFVEEGGVEQPGLKNIASDGYYFSDENNYMTSIQLFCKANCFCRPDLDRTPYSSNSDDPAVKASGGCLRSVPTGVPFNKARSNCDALGGGRLVSVHDEEKAVFVNQLMNKAAPKSDYYWIGYSKTDAGWTWEDQSTNPYDNWDKKNGEPSQNSVAKCTYVDKTSDDLFWGAGNCNTGFPFTCEFAPCEVGNKNC